MCYCFFFNDTATTEIYTYLHTLSLHDALPISSSPPATLRDGSDTARRGRCHREGSNSSRRGTAGTESAAGSGAEAGSGGRTRPARSTRRFRTLRSSFCPEVRRRLRRDHQVRRTHPPRDRVYAPRAFSAVHLAVRKDPTTE